MDNLSSPGICNNLHTGKIQCYGPVRTGMPQDFHGNKLKLKWGDIYTGVRGDLVKVHEGE
jgi:hypothetical protein